MTATAFYRMDIVRAINIKVSCIHSRYIDFAVRDGWMTVFRGTSGIIGMRCVTSHTGNAFMNAGWSAIVL